MIDGKLALVTGAGQGLGAAIAIGFAKNGARVVCADIDMERARTTVHAIEADGGIAYPMQLDVSDRAAADRVAAETETKHGPIDILINNAGICPRNRIDSPDVEETWRQAMAVNLDGTLHMSLAFVAQLRETQGTIVNMASVAAFVSTATSLAYSTSKAGVKMLTQSLAQELAADGIRVNAIAPGPMKTDITLPTREDPERYKQFLTRIPLGRFGDPEELVGPALFLASGMSSYVTGTTLVVDGGYLAV
ncbi:MULTISPECIES: SDR family NAD(P)-dependent oxidoreductase [Nisaea]|uniref:SDR family NAD(P)-dependent oxidoreductase n=1 Tax=Nisaea TaxID=390876 RepID=UPI00041A1746|nr:MULTISPECIES: glucose 1-dehydrogenase [Nisaea]